MKMVIYCLTLKLSTCFKIVDFDSCRFLKRYPKSYKNNTIIKYFILNNTPILKIV